MGIGVLIQTKDEELNLPHALESVRGWASQVFVLDAGSSDGTQAVAERYGATFVTHEWEGFARQKNWGLDNLPFTSDWIFILDADECVTNELRDELRRVAAAADISESGFFVNRHLVFLGRPIRHCGYYPSWNLRFFRRGRARYEDRAVHEHMIVEGSVGYLKGEMVHWDRRGMEWYIAKHNHYSTLEAKEMLRIRAEKRETGAIGSILRDPIARRRWIKERVWPRLPARWLWRWVFMYLLRGGFLDGLAGFHFCLVLAAYEHQITIKMLEQGEQGRCAEE